jgi:hypothetical protein
VGMGNEGLWVGMEVNGKGRMRMRGACDLGFWWW